MSGFSPDLLAGRRILITGASSGIGRSVAQQVAACGGRVLATGRNAERLQAVVDALGRAEHRAIVADLDGPDEVADWCKAVALEEKGIDGIFHGAGTELVRPVRLTKSEYIDHTFRASLYAALGLARAAAMKEVLREPGGSIVFMSSVAGHRGQAGMVAYSAAKAGIDGLVRSLACELAARRIRVNSIVAGAVQTDMHARIENALGPAAVADYEARHLLGFGEPADIASAVVYLLSDLSRWVTGATWAVDGGYMVR